MVTSSATTFPRVEIGDVTEMKVQDKGYDVRMLYCNIDVISQSYGTSIVMQSRSMQLLWDIRH